MASNKNAFIYYLNDFSGDLFFSGNKQRVEIGNSTNDWQTEGIAYRSMNELYISCETSYTTATLYQTLKSSMLVVGSNELQKTFIQIQFPIFLSSKVKRALTVLKSIILMDATFTIVHQIKLITV
jgi:hypothetical protein